MPTWKIKVKEDSKWLNYTVKQSKNTETLRDLICILELKGAAAPSLNMVLEKSWNLEDHSRAKGQPEKCNYRRSRNTQGDTRTIHQTIDV